MADECVLIPSKLEEKITTFDDTEGTPFRKALEFVLSSIPNVYSLEEDGTLVYSFTDGGKGYGDVEDTTVVSQTAMNLKNVQKSSFRLVFEERQEVKWGINFCGVIRVYHVTGEERLVYLPGTRTYDPAGMTGDPHSSERIGPSCSRSQTSVTVAQLYAALNGAGLDQVRAIQTATREAILHYHGRECLFDWMCCQIEEAVYNNKGTTPYPEFIRAWLSVRGVPLTGNRGHTASYLESFDKGAPCPPLEFYRKVAQKDDVATLLTPPVKAQFDKIIAGN